MSMNSLSSTRFAPPQQARLNPQVAQQRNGVSEIALLKAPVGEALTFIKTAVEKGKCNSTQAGELCDFIVSLVQRLKQSKDCFRVAPGASFNSSGQTQTNRVHKIGFGLIPAEGSPKSNILYKDNIAADPFRSMGDELEKIQKAANNYRALQLDPSNSRLTFMIPLTNALEQESPKAYLENIFPIDGFILPLLGKRTADVAAYEASQAENKVALEGISAAEKALEGLFE